MKTDTGGEVYPSGELAGYEPSFGMTLLDHFAGLAMQALVTSDNWGPKDYDRETADRAYGIAAAMVAEKRRREAL